MKTALNRATYGVLCITPDNCSNPWVLFEAGAIGARVGNLVCPLVFGMEIDALRYPIRRYQAKPLDKGGVWEMLVAIHGSIDQKLLDAGRLERSFAAHWPAFEKAISMVTTETQAPPVSEPTPEDLLSELLQGVKSIRNSLEQGGFVPLQTIVDVAGDLREEKRTQLIEELFKPVSSEALQFWRLPLRASYGRRSATGASSVGGLTLPPSHTSAPSAPERLSQPSGGRG